MEGEKVVKSLTNIEIVTLVVYLLGGDNNHIETEDIAIKANEYGIRLRNSIIRLSSYCITQ